MTVNDAEGVSHQYLLPARSLRRAKREARDWVAHAEWDATLVGVRPAKQTAFRTSLALASLGVVACAVTITAAIIFALSLGGVL